MIELGEVMRDLAARGESCALAIIVAAGRKEPRVGAKVVYDGAGVRRAGDAFLSEAAERELAARARAAIDSGEAGLVEIKDEGCGASFTAYVEPQRRGAELLVLGHGPVAEAVARLAADMGLRVRVAGRHVAAEHYPSNVALESVDRFEGVQARGAHVVVTTGHESDEEALRAALESEPATVQLVASSRRAPAVLAALRNEGVAEAKLNLVRAPAGLDVGAEGPDEIALSIVAEVLMLRRGGTGRPLCEVKGTLSGVTAVSGEAACPTLPGRKKSGAVKTKRADEYESDDFRPPVPDESDEFRVSSKPKASSSEEKKREDEDDFRPAKTSRREDEDYRPVTRKQTKKSPEDEDDDFKPKSKRSSEADEESFR